MNGIGPIQKSLAVSPEKLGQTFKNWQKRSVTGGKVCVTQR